MLTASLTSGLTTELAKYEGLKEAVTAGGLAGKVAQDAVIGGTVQAGVGTANNAARNNALDTIWDGLL